MLGHKTCETCARVWLSKDGTAAAAVAALCGGVSQGVPCVSKLAFSNRLYVSLNTYIDAYTYICISMSSTPFEFQLFNAFARFAYNKK